MNDLSCHGRQPGKPAASPDRSREGPCVRQPEIRGDHYVAIGYARAANDLAKSIREPDAKELVEKDYHKLSDFQLVTIISAEAGEAVLLSKFDPRWSMHRDRAEAEMLSG